MEATMKKAYRPDAQAQAPKKRGQGARPAAGAAWVHWLRHRLGRRSQPVAAPAQEPDRLHALRHFLATEFEGRRTHMSGRDQRLYHRLVQSESLDALRHLRFECFDLMCRLLGEGTARTHQVRIDAWLTSRQ
jgi:hypothetical protein